MAYPLLARLVRPYIYHELPGWGRVFGWAGIGGIDNTNPKWKGAPTVKMRGKRHGYLMRLALSDDMDRATYFLGRYFDLEIQLVLDELLKAGDTFVDVGANVGRTTLHAASRVGSNGRVVAFEPQPSCCERIREAISDNRIEHITLHNMGLSDAPAELKLKVLGGGSVMASFAVEESDRMHVREEVTVAVDVGDKFLAEGVKGDMTIKIDVEGFELHVVRGLTSTISEHRPAVLTEVEPKFLRRAGEREDRLFEFFHARGYEGYALGLGKRGLRWNPVLRPVLRASDLRSDSEHDVLWLHPARRTIDPSRFMARGR